MPGNNNNDVVLIGGGVGSLTTAALLANSGRRVTVLEHNHVAGGCASSFYRKGYWFESGATTLVGLDPGMPLRHVLDTTGIEFPVIPLATPMQVHLADGTVVTRYQDLEAWIHEAERVFGSKNQRAFWEFCYDISRFVWDTSLEFRAFPPSSAGDIFETVPRIRPRQVLKSRFAFHTMRRLLQRFDLLDNQPFVDFVNEQLMITAQNTSEEVNVLFGATALCYTNYTNYYVPGGLIRMIDAFADFIRSRGSQLICRATVTGISRLNDAGPNNYRVTTENNGDFDTPCVVSGVPIQNTIDLVADPALVRRHSSRALPSHRLWSAFSMGLVFNNPPTAGDTSPVLHHQIHLSENESEKEILPGIAARSIFLSLSHPDDEIRGPADQTIASISTHIPDPANNEILDIAELEAAIIQILIRRGFIQTSEQIIYKHCSTPKTWRQWTRRKHGFVGGHPQFRSIKPWRMLDARLAPGFYQCGDTAYPGQGIPGACLSGIIAHHKLTRDHSRASIPKQQHA